MSYRTNLFSKMVILILIMLIPVVLLYWYSNHKTTAVLRDELNRSNSNQLEFFQNQVNTHIELLSSWPNLLIHDPDIASFRRIYTDSRYFDLDAINLVKRIQNKLSIQESSSNWTTKLYLYSPSMGRVVSERDARFMTSRHLGKVWFQAGMSARLWTGKMRNSCSAGLPLLLMGLRTPR